MDKKVSTWNAALTMTRLCVGSGLLALPYATTRGGLLFSPLGLIFIAAWNGLACLQLIACRDRTKSIVVPSSISSSYAKIAYCGLGWIGVICTDASIFVTLLGVCVSTLINAAALLHDMFGNTLAQLDTFIVLVALITYPLILLKNMSMLASLSPIGMFCLFLNVAAIVGYGVALYGSQLSGLEVNLWPQSPPDLASYTGIAIFCFGLCTLALQVEESMEQATEFPIALGRCLVIVCAVYFFVGDLVALLYSHDATGVNGNILLNLPRDAIVSNFSRVAMVAACILYLPLAFLPPANIFERLLMNSGRYVCDIYRQRKKHQHEDMLANESYHSLSSSSAIINGNNAVEMRTLLPSTGNRGRSDSISSGPNKIGAYDACGDYSASPSGIANASNAANANTSVITVNESTVSSNISTMNNDSQLVSININSSYSASQSANTISNYNRVSDSFVDEAAPGCHQQDHDHDHDHEVEELDIDYPYPQGPEELDIDTSAYLAEDVITYFAEPPYWFMCICRTVLLICVTIVAMKVPCFNMIITLLGCLTISVLSFILPPWMHRKLITEPALRKQLKKQQQYHHNHQQQQRRQSIDETEDVFITLESDSLPATISTTGYHLEKSISNRSATSGSKWTISNLLKGRMSLQAQYYLDVVLLGAGVVMCMASTYVSVLDIYGKLQRGTC